jgi:predicted kinase
MVSMTQTLYIFRGLPASGKSTIAQGMVDKGFGSVVRIERDMLRDQLYNGRIYTRPDDWNMTDEEFKVFLREREDTITQVQNSMVSAALKSGKSVIVSDTNLPAKTVKSWIAMARKHNVLYEIVELDYVSVEECINRDKYRENAVGEEVIRRMADAHLSKGKLRKVEEPKEYNILQIEPYDNPIELPSAIIVDIDGTLAKMSGRSPYEWMRVGEDEPVEAVIDVVNAAVKSGHAIIVMSGRDGSCYDITNTWLIKHLGHNFHLFMRAEGDNRKDDLVKYELFNQDVRNKFHVKYVLDDRDQVVAMWRNLGLPCFQVAYGNF